MSIESAKAYMRRMRDDPEFRKKVNDRTDNDENWKFLQAEGYDFTIEDFKNAQDELVKEVGFSIGKM